MGIIIALFIAVSFGIAYFASRKIQGSAENYFVAGKTLPLWVVALTLSAQSVDSNATLGNTELLFEQGFWAGAGLPIGLAMALLLTGLFFAKPLNSMNLLTLPDYYMKRYGRTVEFLISVLTVVSFTILLAGNLAGVGLLCSFFLGTDYFTTVIVFATLVTLYTIMGGLFSVAWNDVFHISVLTISFLTAFFVIWSVMGTEVVTGAVASIDFEEMTNIKKGAIPNWSAILALGLGDIVALDFMERVFSAKNGRTAQRGCYAAAIITLLVGIPVSILGIIALNTFPELKGNHFLTLISTKVPFVITALVVIGIIGASMSTADGAILATSTVITKNIIFGKSLDAGSDKKLVLSSRLFTFPIIVAAITIALIWKSPGGLLVIAFDVVFAGCLIPLILGLYWKRSTVPAAVVSIIVASSLRLMLQLFMPQTFLGIDSAGMPTLICPLVSLILFVGISLATKPPEKIEGLAREQSMAS